MLMIIPILIVYRNSYLIYLFNVYLDTLILSHFDIIELKLYVWDLFIGIRR